MSAARPIGTAGPLKRKPYFAVAVVGLLVLIIWFATSGARRTPVGAACDSSAACQSNICLPDADPAQVASFVELAKAYEQGSNANPALAGQINELLHKLPSSSSLTLRPRYPGVCTDRCTGDPDCPQDMFCTEVVWLGLIKGIDRGRVQVCMPDEHPAKRLLRR